jgi:DNA end-binding protein Ku
MPADKVGEEAFAVIREAMAATGTAAVSRLVLYRREHAVALVPRGRGIVLWTLRYGDEVRPADDYFGEPAKAEARLTRLVGELIGARTEAWSGDFLKDTVQERMKAIVAGKKPRRGKAAEPEAAEPTGGNVVSILDALKRSVAADKGKRKD